MNPCLKVVPIRTELDEDHDQTKQLPRQLLKHQSVELDSEFGNQTAGQSNSPRGSADARHALPVLRSRNHKHLWIHLSAQPVWHTTNQELSIDISQPYGTIREGLRKLESIGCIKKSLDSNVGLKIEVLIPSGGILPPIKQANQTARADKIDRLDNKSIYPSQADIDRLWPNISKRGFHSAHYRELVQDFETKEFDVSSIKQALNHLEFQLSRNALVDRFGNPVRDVPAYLLKALREKGYYSRPKDYISPEEQAERDRLVEEERIRSTREKATKIKANNWWAELPPGHPAKRERMIGNQDTWIIHQYQKHTQHAEA